MKNKIQQILINDKALHFVYSFFFTCVLYTILQICIAPNASLGIASLAIFSLGIAKELLDEKIDYTDLGFDLMGIVTYVILNLINNM